MEHRTIEFIPGEEFNSTTRPLSGLAFDPDKLDHPTLISTNRTNPVADLIRARMDSR